MQVSQHEWTYLRKNLHKKEKNQEIETEINRQDHPTRHQRALRKHIIELTSSTRQLGKSTKELQDKVISIENTVQDIQYGNFVQYRPNDDLTENSILNEQQVTLLDRISKVESLQSTNSLSIQNLTQQISNYDKLHLSMLELLENVENIENKVDKSVPDFRKEISKLEFNLAQTETKVSALREDQTNTRDSVKAISVSVSNLVDKFDIKMKNIQHLNSTLDQLKESASIQTAKLHDHILKVT